MSAPQIGFPGSTTAQPQAYGVQPQGYGVQPQPGAEWAQAAQYTMATGQLPPGVTPEMIAQEMHTAQEQMAQAKEAQNNMALNKVHTQYSGIIDANNKMEGSFKQASSTIQTIAGSIGDTPVGGDPDDDKTPDNPDTPTATTGTTASTSTVNTATADKMNPANFQANMDKHMAYMPADPATAFGVAQQVPASGFPTAPPNPMAQHLGAQTGAPPTSPYFSVQTGVPQPSPYLHNTAAGG